jgi:predicted secreted hydrolase
MRNKYVLLLLFLTTVYLTPQDRTAADHATQSYRIAQPGYSYEFPRDYFNHEEFQTEWWYYTGNVRSSHGHRFGYELTFFRQGVSRARNSQPWFVNDMWMAHLALSDINGQRFYNEERLNRTGPGLAGVNAQTGIVWNGNWQAHITDREEELRGIANKFGLMLKLMPAKRPTIQGPNGVSQKAEGVGHASQYFSITRLTTTGAISIGGNTYQVDGTSWMDHEFFTGSMSSNETGWDWLSVQFKDSTELMLYRLRHADGTIDPYSSGTYIDATGTSLFLSEKDFTMTVATDSADSWLSPVTKARYPVHWHVSIPRLKIEVDITTPLKNQELTGHFGPPYWEGTIHVAGDHNESPTSGFGYLEMTGYAVESKTVVPR